MVTTIHCFERYLTALVASWEALAVPHRGAEVMRVYAGADHHAIWCQEEDSDVASAVALRASP